METSDKLKEKEKETNKLKTQNYTALL